jgi:BolA protein
MNVRDQIRTRLQVLNPTVLHIVDDSSAHAGHAGAASHAERTGAVEGTHFEVTVVSPAFAGKAPVARHRMIYDLLDDLLKTRIHALKIDARPE